MRRVISLVLGVFLLGIVAVPARAQEEDLGFIPDPESRFFGLQVAWMQVGENLQRLITFNEEKEAELEVRFAQREQRLFDRLDALGEENPEAAARLEGLLEKLRARHERRLERLDQRIERIQTRRGAFEERKDAWVEEMQERRDELLQRREEIQNRIQEHRVGDEEATESGEVEDGEDEGEEIGGQNVIEPRRFQR